MHRSRFALLAAIGTVALLAACSSSHHASPTTTTTAPGASTTVTSASGATTSTGATPSSSTSVTPSSAPPTTTTAGVRIVRFTGPPSPVDCNSPTSVELRFETRKATSVTLRINGGAVFATYSTGAHNVLAPLACDGNAQTYLLTARDANGATATKTLTLEEHAVM